MELLELACNDQLNPKRVATTNGGEYHSPCPGCRGKDRFIIWSAKNRYLCRQCGKMGDVIQYLRDFHGYSFQEACRKANVEPNPSRSSLIKSKKGFTPMKLGFFDPQWLFKATKFVEDSHRSLLANSEALTLLKNRGFSLDSIQKFKIGWNPTPLFVEWLDETPKRKIWLPKGIVIPSFRDESLQKIKIRRTDWTPEDEFPKYLEIRGSISAPSIYTMTQGNPIIIVESELDGMLVEQEGGNLCHPVALGGVSKKPDEYLHSILLKAPLILFSLDYDEAGIKAFSWWRKQYKALSIWVTPFEKSIGDAFLKGLDVKTWISLGIEKFVSHDKGNEV